MAGTLLLIALITVSSFAFEPAAATSHTVGGSSGWTIPSTPNLYSQWASSQKFAVGDTLLFNFTTGQHNVMEVSKSSYDSCSTKSPIGSTLSTGPATVTIKTAGMHYYICGIPTHCSIGQKLTISTSSSGSSSVPAPAPAGKSGSSGSSSAPAPAPAGKSASSGSSPAPAPTGGAGSPGSSPAPSPAGGAGPSGSSPASSPAAVAASPMAPSSSSKSIGMAPTSPSSSGSGANGPASSNPSAEGPSESAAPQALIASGHSRFLAAATLLVAATAFF